MMDSVITSGSKKVLIGNIEDPLFGKVKSSSYFELTPETYTITNAAEAVYDSTVLYLTYNDYYYGDTLQAFKFKVSPLQDRIKLNDQGYLYNNSNFNVNQEVVGTGEFLPKPNTDSTYVKVNLSDSYGQSIFNRLKNDDIISQEYFLNFYKGLAITPETTNNAMLRFGIDASYVVDASDKNISTLVRIYYHTSSQNGTEVQKYTLDLNPSTTYQYNKVEHDFTGSALSGLSPDNPISSVNLGNKAYMMAGLGVYTKVQIPYIKNFGDAFSNYQILSAYLYISPANGYYTNNFYSPTSLYYFLGDQYDTLQSSFTDTSGNAITVSLTEGTEFQNDYKYTISISDFLNTSIQTGEINKYSILIYPSESNGAMVNKLIVGDAKDINNPAKAEVYLIAY